MGKNVREIIYNILYEVEIKGAFSNISIGRNIDSNLDSRDESFIREIVYGVLENKLYIDYIIKQFSKIKFNKIDDKVKQVLRMGIYQIIFMDKVPDSAACNESVNLVKKVTHKGVEGFVNGVLRNVSRNKNNIKLPNKINKPLDYISIKYSHPEWMVSKWIKEFGFEFTENLCIANNKRPKLNIRVNTLKINRKNLMDILIEKGFLVNETKISNYGLIIDNPIRITETEEYKKGYFSIQDESSMLVAETLNPKEGSIVVDLCSAPGGKATHIAQIMKNKGKIISRDIYPHKLKMIDDISKRLNIDIIETEKFDALKLDENLIGKADYCIVDAPCSGLGIIRRKPEIKWNKNEEDLKNIRNIQMKILENGSKYIKKGGCLVYSTCTIEKDENINLIKNFIKNNSDMELTPIEIKSIDDLKDNLRKGYMELYPNLYDTDGFFIAKITKK